MLQDPPVQDIRDIRHHIHCQKLCDVTGYYCQSVDDTTTDNSSINKNLISCDRKLLGNSWNG